MIAVCLLTCGRFPLTRRTVESFGAQNGARPDLIRLHAAGDHEIFAARAFITEGGFVTVHAPNDRVPQMVSYRKLIEAAALKGAEFVLWLENDWESVAPIPSIDFLRRTQKAGVVCWRLFGARRMQSDTDRGLVKTTQIGTDIPIEWKRDKSEKGWELGRAHWGGGGCIATLRHLESQIFRNRLKDVVTAKPDLLSMRPTSNIMWHVGEERTPGLH